MQRDQSIVMDLTERCNLRCTMCYFSTTDRIRFPPFDRVVSENGHMPVATFERLAEIFFPRAERIALACAAEPLVHKEFARLVRLAGSYEPPELWFPTNLLALNAEKAEAIAAAGVTTVGVSMDGFDAPTYEKIRVGGRFAQLLEKLDLLNRARRGTKTRLRIIFTWMKSNRAHLALLPAFAEAHGAEEIDVRFVSPTVGVDNAAEVLTAEPAEALNEELASTAEDAVRRGLKLAYYPAFHRPEDFSPKLRHRIARGWWRRRAGLERPEAERERRRRRENGCAHPGHTYVIRPNGAIAPCIFWNEAPFGVMPEGSLEEVDRKIAEVVEGLRCGNPIGSCVGCSQRQDAFYEPFRARA